MRKKTTQNQLPEKDQCKSGLKRIEKTLGEKQKETDVKAKDMWKSG